ncbi:MAG: hypothetical protein ACOYI4_02190 [Christensenellales bacterium]
MKAEQEKEYFPSFGKYSFLLALLTGIFLHGNGGRLIDEQDGRIIGRIGAADSTLILVDGRFFPQAD